ncbi:MAG: hypothetical protein ACLQF2_13300 [Rhodomicrobium sp.]
MATLREDSAALFFVERFRARKVNVAAYLCVFQNHARELAIAKRKACQPGVLGIDVCAVLTPFEASKTKDQRGERIAVRANGLDQIELSYYDRGKCPNTSNFNIPPVFDRGWAISVKRRKCKAEEKASQNRRVDGAPFVRLMRKIRRFAGHCPLYQGALRIVEYGVFRQHGFPFFKITFMEFENIIENRARIRSVNAPNLKLCVADKM